jgi:hypothetical protein
VKYVWSYSSIPHNRFVLLMGPSQEVQGTSLLKMGLIGCPETSVQTLRHIPEGGRSRLLAHGGGSLKSDMRLLCYNLAYERASLCSKVPRLWAVCPSGKSVEYGALVV